MIKAKEITEAINDSAPILILFNWKFPNKSATLTENNINMTNRYPPIKSISSTHKLTLLQL